MKRKSNDKKKLSTNGPVELRADELEAVSGGSGSHHVKWYEWSTWNFKDAPVPGTPGGPTLP